MLFLALPAALRGRAAGLAGDDLDAYLVATYETRTMTLQAADLAVSLTSVNRWRVTLRRAGWVDPQRRAGVPRIPAAEAGACARLYVAGYSAGAIATMRELPRARVEGALKKARAAERQRATTFSGEQVAALFGIHPSLVQGWVRAGWLPDHRHRAHRGIRHLWDRVEIVAFLRDRRSWAAWAPTQITDPELRRIAERARAAAGGQWYQHGEIADLLGVTGPTLSAWCAADQLLAGLTWQPWAGAGPHYAWLSIADAARFAAWGEQVRTSAGQRRRRLTAALRVWLGTTYGRAANTPAADQDHARSAA